MPRADKKNKPIKLAPDSRNAVRRALISDVKLIEKTFLNTMTGYVILAWPYDSDDCIVGYNKGYLPIDHLLEYAVCKLSESMQGDDDGED